MLVVADPGDVVDAVRPGSSRQAAGLVEQQAATAVRQAVQPALLRFDVAEAAAGQGMLVAEVVADPAPPGGRFGGQQFGVRACSAQNVGCDRDPFGLIGVQQAGGCPAADLGGQLPAQVERVLGAEVEALPAHRRVNVRRIPGQQHPAVPVALGLPGGVAEPAESARRVDAEVRSGQFAQPVPELLEVRRGGPVRGVHSWVPSASSAGAPVSS